MYVAYIYLYTYVFASKQCLHLEIRHFLYGIESALQGVRSSLASRSAAPEYGEPACADAPVADQTNRGADFSGTASRRPALYVAWSAGRRRSAT